RVIEEREVAPLHLVPHVIAGLIVAHSVPVGPPSRRCRQVVDAEHVRLGFHEPMFHRPPPVASPARANRKNAFSVTAPHNGISHGCASRASACWKDHATPSSFGLVHDLRWRRKPKARSK